MAKWIRLPVYLAVIVVAPMLHEPWMIALQAAAGGFALGGFTARRIDDAEAV